MPQRKKAKSPDDAPKVLTLDTSDAIDPAILDAEYTEHLRSLHILNIRIMAARSAQDKQRIDELTALQGEQRKYADFYKEQLRAYPDYTPTKKDFKTDGDRTIIDDTVGFNNARKAARVRYNAAKFTQNKEHQNIAQQDVDRLTAYLAYYEPLFRRIAKRLNAQQSK